MKLFSWMQNKLNGKQENTKPNTVPATHRVKQEAREEFNDWPHGLLAIGTFGNNDLRERNHEIQDIQEEPEQQVVDEDPSSSTDLQDFTPEEIGKLQKELTKLLSRKPNSEKEKENANLPLDRFLNCPSSLEISRRMCNTVISDTDEKEEDDIERTISVILGRCKDICEKNKKKAIGKKSLTFLLKKMFVCRSGFAPQPSLRDAFQESRMEKLLRTLLHKKINPQNASRASSMKTLKNGQEDDEKREKTSHGGKWVKTDSEYIVLEI